ncbi:MAG: hypothetical protein KAJ73_00525 [Zetaproteobacteria bacterium]|nr:hypothetical protein [Zetaproteobacteria bacterium]
MSKNKGGAFLRGAAARKRMMQETQHQETRSEQRKAQFGRPFEFYMAVGEERRIVILDDEPEFCLYEHNMYNPAKTGYSPPAICIKEADNCPLCEVMEKDSVYILFLSIIDLTPYKDNKGKTVKFSRKFMKVKLSQQKKFVRRWEREGTLRGAVFTMVRDGDKDARIGNDIEFEGFMEEEELRKYVRKYKDKDGKKHTEKCSEVCDYEKYFPLPTKEELRKLAGSAATPGSRAEHDEEMKKGKKKGKKKYNESEDDDGMPWDEDDNGNKKKGKGGKKKGKEEPTRRGSRRQAVDSGNAPTGKRRRFRS